MKYFLLKHVGFFHMTFNCDISPYVLPKYFIVMKSTVPPGTCTKVSEFLQSKSFNTDNTLHLPSATKNVNRTANYSTIAAAVKLSLLFYYQLIISCSELRKLFC